MNSIIGVRRIVVLCAVILIGIFTGTSGNEVHAASVQENDRGVSVVRNLGAGSDGSTWKNPHYKNSAQYIYTIRSGGEERYGYCFQTGKQFSNGHSYTAKRPANASAWTNLSADRQRLIRLIMFYGYNKGKAAPVSGANANDYFAATQALIWEAADGDVALTSAGKWSKSTNSHYNLIAGRTKAVQCYNWIKNEISKHVKGPSFAASTASAAATHVMKYDYSTGKWAVSLKDTGAGNYYRLISGSVVISRSGHTYKFTAASAGNRTAVLMNEKISGTGQELMVFRPSNSGKQSIVTGASDDTYFYTKFRTEKEGQAAVTVTTSDGGSPEGFRYLIENKQNGYSRIHTVSDTGKIEISLYPGTYTVTGVLTEEQKEKGYVTPSGGKLEIGEGGTAKLELVNVRKTVPFKIVKTSDSGKVNDFEFAVFDVSGAEIVRGKTSEEGLFAGELFPGEYTVKEYLTEEQIKEGYRAGKPQILELTSQQSGIQELRFHNLWEPIDGKIAIRKSTDDGGPEGGFGFNIEGTVYATGETYSKRNCVTDKTGQYLTEEMQPGTYTITEVLTDKQAERYTPAEPVSVEIREPGEGVIVNFENKAIRTPVTVDKSSEDGKIQGVKFSVEGTLAWGEEFDKKIMTTDDNGQFTIDLQPGDYTITEIGETAAGYQPQPPKEITVTGKETPVNISFVNIPNSLILTKYEVLENGMETDTPVAGAVYEVYRVERVGTKETAIDYGRFTTDENGKFVVKGIAPGEYFLREIKAPAGYERNDSAVSAVFREQDVSVEIKDTNRRAKGSISVSVSDKQGNPVSANEMGIFLDPGCMNPMETFATDATGRFRIEDLPWGTYYIKEIKSTRGYLDNPEIKAIKIGKDGVTEAEHIVVKEQKRGSLLINKTDETGALPLKGAVFSLYKTDGTLIKQGLTTDKYGTLLVSDLEWGSYYLLETEAPAGYGLSDNPVRFSVNATTAGKTQEISVINEAEKCSIVIDKKIKAADLHYDHGTPVFTFKVHGITVDNEEKGYTKQVAFSEEYVLQNTDTEGYVKATVVFTGLKAGQYRCTEKDTLRYRTESVAAISSNCTVSPDGWTAEFELAGQDYGHAEFVNEKIDWRDFSDSVSINNIIKAEKKLTSLAVEYLGPETLDGNMPFDADKYLEVTAFYDDGSERALAPEEYIMLNGDGSIFGRTDSSAGRTDISVHYSEGGIHRSDTFGFAVKGAESVTVTFDTCGGRSLDPLNVWKYDALRDYPQEKTMTEREGYKFTGWYSDAQMETAFTEADYITENITLYAGWEQMHLSDYSWDQLKAISDGGGAEAVLGECFDAVKEDLADDGLLSAESYIHTKAFDSQGIVCHAMIAGFRQDKKTDGSAAGISFLVYEPSAAKAMITADTGRDLGWSTSYMRTTVIPAIYKDLPQAMKDVLSKVVKTDLEKKGTDMSVRSVEDTLWLPSRAELYGTDGQYALFAGILSEEVAVDGGIYTAAPVFWTRSVDASLDRAFYYVDATGVAASK